MKETEELMKETEESTSVNINVNNYIKLISAKAKLKIIEKMYKSEISKYDYDSILELIFTREREKEGGTNQ